MRTLHNLQNNFVTAVFEDNNSGFSQSIVSDSINGSRRLQIYHNNIYISLSNALSAVYPVVNRLVGDDFFKFMATEYIKKHPSRSGNLHEFGNQFSLFIRGFQPADALVYLSDVAQLEWAYHSVFHEADSPEFDISKLEQIDKKHYDKLFFIPNPASRIVKSAYPILNIWQANQDTQLQDDDSSTEPEIINIDQGGTRLLVIRRNMDIEFQILEHDEYVFLNAIYHSTDFFATCDATMQENPECNIGHLLLKHIQAHTLTDCKIHD